jgi:Zn ribbon nucleic-acid-binding protein
MDSCKVCDKKYVYSKELRKKGYRKAMCNSCSVTQARRRRKEKAINYKGGECVICGYNKHQSALQFHHILPEHKDFGFSSKGYTRSWESQKAELDKCVLLCSNCHCEVHAGMHEDDLLFITSRA